jgi:hypothetical protein
MIGPEIFCVRIGFGDTGSANCFRQEKNANLPEKDAISNRITRTATATEAVLARGIGEMLSPGRTDATSPRNRTRLKIASPVLVLLLNRYQQLGIGEIFKFF